MLANAGRIASLAKPGCSRGSPVVPVTHRRMQAKVVSTKAAPATLSISETQDAVKYAKVASVAYQDDQATVLKELQQFESLPGEKPFAKLKAADLRLVKIQSVVFDPISWLGGKIQTDTEVLFIKVPGKGFDQDALKAKGDQLIVAFRGTETDKTMGLWSDVFTDVRAFRSSIRDMKGLEAELRDQKYDDMLVHRGFLTSFNDLMTGGTAGDISKTMDRVAADLLGKGNAPARVVCCGHSLGAALATLGAFWWAKKYPEVEVFCYAYASPRVGNDAFTKVFLAGTGEGKKKPTVATEQVDKAYRFTHKSDPVPTVPPTWFGYNHVEQSVFLIEPKENTWGVKDADQVPLAPGQDYVALLTNRPINYLLNPFDGLAENHHSMDQHLEGLQNILVTNKAAVTAVTAE